MRTVRIAAAESVTPQRGARRAPVLVAAFASAMIVAVVVAGRLGLVGSVPERAASGGVLSQVRPASEAFNPAVWIRAPYDHEWDRVVCDVTDSGRFLAESLGVMHTSP